MYTTQHRYDNFWLTGRSLASLLRRAGWPAGDARFWAGEVGLHGYATAVDADRPCRNCVLLLPNGRQVLRV